MTTKLAEVKRELLGDPDVRAAYEALNAPTPSRHGKYSAQLARRDFRVRQRAANRAPLSTKVVHRGGRVDAGPKAKPKAKGK